MIVSWSGTMDPQSPALTIRGTVPKESDDLDGLKFLIVLCYYSRGRVDDFSFLGC